MPVHGDAAVTAATQSSEDQGVGARLAADRVAAAFGVDVARVRRAIEGEFGRSPDDGIDSRQAQHLAEIFLVDQPLDRRLAVLMQLGAYTPRSDAEWGLGDASPGEESDLQAARADVPPTELASLRSSHDPATQPVE
jgi:hypothetical protein